MSLVFRFWCLFCHVCTGVCCAFAVMGDDICDGSAGGKCVVFNCFVCMLLMLLFAGCSSEHPIRLLIFSLVVYLFFLGGRSIFHSDFSQSDNELPELTA